MDMVQNTHLQSTPTATVSSVSLTQSERRFKSRRITELLRYGRETLREYNQQEMSCASHKLSEPTALSIP